MDQPDIPLPDEMLDRDDDAPRCPECGAKMTEDWEGDPDVIGGTRSLLVCTKCPVMMPADQFNEDIIRDINEKRDAQ